jgi:hypothetical protein
VSKGEIAFFLLHPLWFVKVRWDVWQLKRSVKALKREVDEHEARRQRAMRGEP